MDGTCRMHVVDEEFIQRREHLRDLGIDENIFRYMLWE
jgi:hypothetical protein